MNLRAIRTETAVAACIVMLLAGQIAVSQIPPSNTLSTEDRIAFEKELARVLSLLHTAGNPSAIQFQMARTYAAGGQYADAMQWLQTIVDADAGFDPLHSP